MTWSDTVTVTNLWSVSTEHSVKHLSAHQALTSVTDCGLCWTNSTQDNVHMLPICTKGDWQIVVASSDPHDQLFGIHCLIICTIQLLTPNNLGGTWRRICSPDIQSVSTWQVLGNHALQNRHLLTYLLTHGQLGILSSHVHWSNVLIMAFYSYIVLTIMQSPG